MADAELWLRDARPGEDTALEELQRRASLHWDDTRAALLARPELVRFRLADHVDGWVRVAEVDGVAVGFAAAILTAPRMAELDGLFVEPAAMGRGIGAELVRDARRIATAAGIDEIGVIANPNTVGFYERCGFVALGDVATELGPGLQMRLSVTPT